MSAPLTDEQVAQLQDLQAMHDEPLDPELEPWLEDMPGGGKMLRHPLVYSVPMSLNGWVNRQLVAKRAAVEEAAANGDDHGYVFLHERPHRLTAFIDGPLCGSPIPLIDLDTETIQLAAEVWVDTENVEQMGDVWTALFEGADRLVLYRDDDDLMAYSALPDEFTVWRGADPTRKFGWSWTTNRATAEFFAARAENGVVYERQARKRDVFGCLAGRGESEVLLHPEGDR